MKCNEKKKNSNVPTYTFCNISLILKLKEVINVFKIFIVTIHFELKFRIQLKDNHV